MILAGSSISGDSERSYGWASLPAVYCEARWYAAYTIANHEKRVAKQLEQKSVEHFLPLYDSVRRWKDRRVKLQLPLFPGYLFVRIPLSERLPHPYLKVGRQVRMESGPLAGLQGVLVRRKKQSRFVVSVELISRSVAVEIDEADLKPV